MEPAPHVKHFKIQSLLNLTLLAISLPKYLQQTQRWQVQYLTPQNEAVICANNQLTVYNSRPCSEAKASTSDMNLDNDRMHLSPSNKHAGHELVVKAYNGPSLAHQQN